MAQYFLAYFIWTSCLVAGQSPKYVLKGQEVNWKPEITGQPNDILWKHNGNKVAEFDGKEQRVYSPFENRITLDWVSAELRITDLTFEDSGNYDLEAYTNNVLHRSYFQLEVIDKVVKSTISCEMNNDSSGNLLCSVEASRHQDVMFEWSAHGNVQHGPQLSIPLGDKHDDEVYSCRASNPLSSETATFTGKDCYPGKSSPVAGIVVCIILLLISIAVFFCLRHRKALAHTGKRKRDDLENPLTRGSREDKTTDQEGAKRLLMNSDPASQHKEDGDPHKITVEPTEKSRRGSESLTFEKINEPESDGSEKEVDEDKDKQSVPASGETAPTAQPRSTLNKISPNMAPKDSAGEHKEESDSDQVTGETVRESDSSGIQQLRNESDDSSEENQLSTIPDQNGSETSVHEQDSKLSQEETHTRKDNHQETDKTVSEDESESEIDKKQNLSIVTSLQPQSPTPTKPGRNRNTSTFPESPDTAHADPDREGEGKTRQDSAQSEGQSESCTADVDKGTVADKIKLFEGGGFRKVQQKNSENEWLDGGQSAIPQDEAPEQGSEKEVDEDMDKQSVPASGETAPTAQPRSTLTKISPNMAPKDSAGEHKEESDSDQVTGETVRESDSSGDQQLRNESNDSSEEKQLSTIPDQNGSETSVHEQDSKLSQEETHTRKDNHQETDKTVSEDESESDSVVMVKK